jgi:hypothetical protein
MSKPDFKAMSQKEDLHNYVLAHRDDQEAFYVYLCRQVAYRGELD